MRGRSSLRALAALTVALGLVAVPLAVASPAQAVDACTTRTLSQPFTAWGDNNNYFLVSSGTFESGTSGWTLPSGASRVAENEPWKVAGNGSYSLKITSGTTLSAPAMCVTSDEDSARFFYKSPATFASLLITVKVTNSITRSPFVLNVPLTSGQAGWQLSPRVALPDLTGTQGTDVVEITLTPQTAGAWQFDDVFVDPSRTR
jgi:hypothetical protein